MVLEVNLHFGYHKLVEIGQLHALEVGTCDLKAVQSTEELFTLHVNFVFVDKLCWLAAVFGFSFFQLETLVAHHHLF
jgi:hypothetical protein